MQFSPQRRAIILCQPTEGSGVHCAKVAWENSLPGRGGEGGSLPPGLVLRAVLRKTSSIASQIQTGKNHWSAIHAPRPSAGTPRRQRAVALPKISAIQRRKVCHRCSVVALFPRKCSSSGGAISSHAAPDGAESNRRTRATKISPQTGLPRDWPSTRECSSPSSFGVVAALL
jgi:hypothetical protein